MIYKICDPKNQSSRYSAIILALLVFILTGPAMAQNTSQQDKEINNDIQLEIIDSVTAALRAEYLFPDKVGQIDSLIRDRYNNGNYRDINSCKKFTYVLSKDLQGVTKDLHLRIYYYPDEYFDTQLNQEPDQKEIERRLLHDRRRNFEFKRVDILPGNIGYLKFDRFRDAKDAAPTAIAALNFLSNCDALIIDLRDNGGGDPNMVQLIMSYFFDGKILFNDLYNPAKDEHNQLWTYAYVPGKRLNQCDVYVLVSFDTFSAGEALAYHLKHSGRATIVGAQTPGGAHDSEFHNCRNLNIRIKIPCRMAISPFTGTNWESVGVAPDIKVPSYEALDVAYLEAVKKLIDNSTDEDQLAELKWVLPVATAKIDPVNVSEDILQKYVGKYKSFEIFYDHATLMLQMTDRRPMRMLPLSKTMFWSPDVDEWRLEFHVGSDGVADSLTAYDCDGNRGVLPRTD